MTMPFLPGAHCTSTPAATMQQPHSNKCGLTLLIMNGHIISDVTNDSQNSADALDEVGDLSFVGWATTAAVCD